MYIYRLTITRAPGWPPRVKYVTERHLNLTLTANSFSDIKIERAEAEFADVTEEILSKRRRIIK